MHEKLILSNRDLERQLSESEGRYGNAQRDYLVEKGKVTSLMDVVDLLAGSRKCNY